MPLPFEGDPALLGQLLVGVSEVAANLTPLGGTEARCNSPF